MRVRVCVVQPPMFSVLRAAVVLVAVMGGLLLPAGMASAQDPAEADQQARALFRAGAVTFDQGEFEAALRLFQHSYRLSPRHEMLYNIGTCFDRLRRDAEALQAFEQYLALATDGANRDEVAGRVRLLRAQIARARTLSHEAATTAAPDRTGGTTAADDASPGLLARWWFWTGVAGVVAVGVVLAVVLSSGSSVESPVPGRDGFVVRALEWP